VVFSNSDGVDHSKYSGQKKERMKGSLDHKYDRLGKLTLGELYQCMTEVERQHMVMKWPRDDM